MKHANRPRRRKSARSLMRILKWTAALAIVALIVYALTRSAGVRYTDRDIVVVDFSALTADEKQSALQSANRARCTCGCGMTLAQCVSTDMTCPLRDTNIQSIRAIVRAADHP